MRLEIREPIRSDVLVIGGGGAGITAAIQAREMGVDVVIASKSRVGYGNNTFISKGVFAAATGSPDPADDAEAHVRDTLKGGRFINDAGTVRAVAARAAGQIAFLERCGGRFSKKDGRFLVTQAPGHSHPRHVRGENYSGRDFILPLRDHARCLGVRFVEEVFITRLFSSDGSFGGAIGIDSKGGLLAFLAPCAVLATGGYAQVYRQTNNAAGMTGDGHVLAYDLGLSLRDMEFIQFYPTALSNGARILLYETFLARSGGVLRNALGEDILARRGMKDPMAVTRDQLSRIILLEVMEGRGVDGGVIMDLSSISREELDKSRHLLPANRLPGQLRFQVSPTAHFCMGGMVANASARTAVEGLYAAGELCGGMHGANRLAGNALTEVFAMGSVAGTEAAREALNATHRDATEVPMDEEKARLESLWGDGKTDVRELRRTAREVMWLKAGIIREKGGIQEAAGRIHELRDRLNESGVRSPRELIRRIEFENSLTVSEMVCRAALMREESRGAHFRRDYPAEDDRNWMKNIFVRKRGTEMALEAVDVGR